MNSAPRSIDWGEFLDHLPESPESGCSYFSPRPSRVKYFIGDADIPPELQEEALIRGFRRCGDTYYATACTGCNLCISYRVRPDELKLSKSQRRVLRRNSDVVCTFDEPKMTDEKQEIYLRYQYSQHFLRPAFPKLKEGKEFDADGALETMDYQMFTNPFTTREIEMRLNDQLIGFGIMDVAVQSTSLVYFVFDPEQGERSLGTLNILKSIEWAGEFGYQFVYLGYYIPKHPKMDYKAHFRPAEMLDSKTGEWRPKLPRLATPDEGTEPC